MRHLRGALINASVFFQRALTLARRGTLTAHPNPTVGCVITNGRDIVGEGWHIQPGTGHGEVNALADLKTRNITSVDDLTMYVTLEPCCIHGRTPPCTEAILRSGITTVRVATLDPHPDVSGRGVQILRERGIDIQVLPHDDPIAQQAQAQLLGYGSLYRQSRPLVIAKWAQSLDGYMVNAAGRSQWITSAASRCDAHLWRGVTDAIVTGCGTVTRDRPRLSPRRDELIRCGLDDHHSSLVAHAPRLKVVCGSVEEQDIHQLRNDPDTPVWIVATSAPTGCTPKPALVDSHGRTDMGALFTALGHAGCAHVMVEAGPRLMQSVVQSGLADLCVVYLAPRLLGSGQGIEGVAIGADLSHPSSLSLVDARQVGADTRMVFADTSNHSDIATIAQQMVTGIDEAIARN